VQASDAEHGLDAIALESAFAEETWKPCSLLDSQTLHRFSPAPVQAAARGHVRQHCLSEGPTSIGLPHRETRLTVECQVD